MTTATDEPWHGVDEGWGRKAADFATLSEPANCREYVWLQHRLQVGPGDRLLDLACGAGLAVELAGLRGAACAGIDAAPRLIAVARDRSPQADLRVGDMNALPWPDAGFDVVTSFRGIWGTTPGALAEAWRVLVPGGRLGLTVWGHLKACTGKWALEPFRLAAPTKVSHQAAMVALGRPGVGEQLLAESGFVDVERVDVPFVWEFADPQAYARALASTGPAFEAIENIGEAEFLEQAADAARAQLRAGLPLRAELAVTGFVARKPTVDEPAPHRSGFLAEPAADDAVRSMYREDLAEVGFVMNASRLWAHLPAANGSLFELIGEAAKAAGLSTRQRGILVVAAASTRADAYCSLMWGMRLAGLAGEDRAVAVLHADDASLEPADRVLARWARQVVSAPNDIRAADLDELRAAGYDDRQILGITLFVALRAAFATVNDALGAHPDHALRDLVPAAVLDAVRFGRPIAASE